MFKVCSESFNDNFIANLLLTLTVKEFWKSIGNGRDYRKQYNSGTIVDSLVTNAPFYVPPYMILLSRGSMLKKLF